jgi:hypothetical protein
VDPAEESARRTNRRRPKVKPRRYAARASARLLDTAPPARFAALHAQAQFHRDPWTVRSLQDLFSIYLAEISISTGAVVGSGFLAAGIYRHWVVDAPAFLAPVTYVAALGVIFSSIYIRGKFYPSLVTRARIHSTLLASLLLLGLHAVVYFIMRAAG